MAAELSAAPVLLKDVDIDQDKRYLTSIGEFDRVMGGGIVPGSVTLIGGDPGIGKSTIVLQAGRFWRTPGVFCPEFLGQFSR